MKTIQPLSNDLLASSETPADNQVQQPAAAHVTIPVSPHPDPASIYPDAVHALNSSIDPYISPKEAAASDPQLIRQAKRTRSDILLIGLFIVVVSLFSIGSRLFFSNGGTSSALWLTLEVTELLLGIGIIFRKELARILYVAVAVIGICISLYGTYLYFVNLQRFNTQLHTLTIKSQQVADQSASDATKKQQAEQFKKLENTMHDQLDVTTGKLIISVSTGLVVTVIPLIVLTRPRIKAAFRA